MVNTDWIEVFKWFHANPELGFEETKTTEKICEILESEHIGIVKTDLSTGLIAVIHGRKPGKTVCLRADIDALPIQEETGLAYSSCNSNVMHACGHDFHTTVALNTAALLNKMKAQWKGTVYIAFEPGEEAFDGAKLLIGTGVLNHVSEFYGFHVDPSMDAGEVGIKAGGVMAAARLTFPFGKQCARSVSLILRLVPWAQQVTSGAGVTCRFCCTICSILLFAVCAVIEMLLQALMSGLLYGMHIFAADDEKDCADVLTEYLSHSGTGALARNDLRLNRSKSPAGIFGKAPNHRKNKRMV